MEFYKNGHFCSFFFVGNMGQENVLYIILEQKNAYVRQKNKKFKKSKIWHFYKGVNPWVWSKNGHFFNFILLGSVGQEDMFYVILERKNAFLGYKNKNYKKLKIAIFLKGLSHGFWTKMAIFPTSFFRQNRVGKCLLRYSRTKKRISRL